MAFTLEQVKESALRRDRLRNKTSDRIRWVKNRDLCQKFGITLVEYERLLQEQNGLCAICGEPETWRRKGKVVALSVDHDHATEEVRGLLCYHCNTALGKVRENPRIVRSMLGYILKYKGEAV